MADNFEKAKSKVHAVAWDLEKVRSLANHNKDAVEWVHHISVATYGAIKTERNAELLALATDAVNEYNLACAYIFSALESLGKAQADLEKYDAILNGKTPDA